MLSSKTTVRKRRKKSRSRALPLAGATDYELSTYGIVAGCASTCKSCE